MDAQLILIESHPDDWRLDEQTRAVGLHGIEQAREALRAARAEAERRQPDAA
jgi:hypothetical protein